MKISTRKNANIEEISLEDRYLAWEEETTADTLHRAALGSLTKSGLTGWISFTEKSDSDEA
jgi:hypothetical protein|tara:strand:- start:580 stop:762 length:183 start_codon:yes stop_codon:yes gene_type:complete